MKALSKLLVAISVVIVSSALVSCKDTVITPDKLPEAAQSFIKEYFPGSTVSFVKKDAEIGGATYEVTLQDATEIEFNGKGEWDKVDCRRAAIPSALVPSTIADYVQTSFPGQIIVKIDKDRLGYEIELGNDLELKFDNSGKLRNIDD